MAGKLEQTTLADVSADVAYGYTESASDEKVGPRFLRITDIQNGVVDWHTVPYCPISESDHRKYRLHSGDIVVARTGNSTGENYLYRSTEDAVYASYLIRFRVNQRSADPAFVWYNMRTQRWQDFINSSKTGSAQAGANAKVLGLFPLPLPPLAEQKAIAAVLGALDDKIELNRRMNATLEAMARALFQSWFVDFDPVRRNKDEGARTKDEISALFPSCLDDGEDGSCPSDWRHAAVEELCEINGLTLSKRDNFETLEYVEISEVSRGNIVNIAVYPRGEEPSRARRRLRHGDTVLSTVRPDRGSYFLSLNPPESRVASTGFAVITPKKAPWSFLHAALTHPEVFDHLGHMADGGAYPAVRPEIIGAMKVVFPNEPKILEVFHNFCAPLFEQAEANRIQSRTLATLRDTLLPKLLSGELSVASLESELENAK
jgi:type I restriction enzyme S subunit